MLALGFGNRRVLTPASDWQFPTPRSKGASKIPVNVRLSVTTAETAVDAAIAGVGATRVLHYQATEAIAQGDLHTILSAAASGRAGQSTKAGRAGIRVRPDHGPY